MSLREDRRREKVRIPLSCYETKSGAAAKSERRGSKKAFISRQTHQGDKAREEREENKGKIQRNRKTNEQRGIGQTI